MCAMIILSVNLSVAQKDFVAGLSLIVLKKNARETMIVNLKVIKMKDVAQLRLRKERNFAHIKDIVLR